jgi:DNA-binding NarL/FixJ family response regulator
LHRILRILALPADAHAEREHGILEQSQSLLQCGVVTLLQELHGAFYVGTHDVQFSTSAARSQHDSLETIRQAFRSGGRDYVVKSDAAKELVTAVRVVSEKKQYMNARFVAQL